ncbi:MAG: WecB/TagA/CpsF family glycosyltransferase [Planctomycetes bacterium]|nr:WecB/TagA/CpsF family glycosyltransferase [Planctomycetota bacterium]
MPATEPAVHEPVPCVDVLGIPIAAIDLVGAADRIEEWIRSGRRTYVTVTGVHGVMESQDDAALGAIHRAAGMCVPDGMPMVWVGKLMGHRRMGRVYGPDLMLELCRRSVDKGYAHYFYGAGSGVAERLRERLVARFPGLCVVGVGTPPFRALTASEEEALGRELEACAPDVLWIGLGTPKQERWMAAHAGKLNAGVMIGVGAAFDMHAGRLRQAPRWMQRAGLEWLFRLYLEPRRLWRRYLRHNPRFLVRIVMQFLGVGGRRSGTAPLSQGRAGSCPERLGS